LLTLPVISVDIPLFSCYPPTQERDTMNTKSDILTILEQNRHRDVSGQELANTLGVSRTAIWKAVKALEREGHRITAAPKRGYRLANEVLSAEGISACLNSPLPVHFFPVIDSTNSEAKRMALSGAAHGTVLTAETQTAGRGRFGKSFYSPEGTGLYMSVILKPGDTAVSDAQMITVAAAVVVSEAIEKLTGQKPGIKWVNDLYLNGKKICGILTEAVSDFESGRVESIIIGIGINCSTRVFPEELTDIAGSLGDGKLSRNRLAALIAEDLISIFSRISDPNIITEYKARSIMIGKTITYLSGNTEHTAVVKDINDRGNLVVEGSEGSVNIISSGEVTIKQWQR